MRRVAILYRFENKSVPYFKAVRDAGADPVGVTPARSIESLDGFSGLLLTGGSDVDPTLFGQARERETGQPDRERDQLELRLLTQVLERDLPVLAICRGMQLFNVAHGGTLLQHVEGHARKLPDAGEPVHAVAVVPGTVLERITHASRLEVNSRHHQAVDRVGDGLIVSARSIPDAAAESLVEGLEHPAKRFAIAVQWHPEDQIRTCSPQRELFCAFVRELA